MRFQLGLSERKGQRYLLFVNGELIRWEQLEQLVALGIGLEELNHGKYPLRNHIKKITDNLTSKAKMKKGNGFDLSIEYEI